MLSQKVSSNNFISIYLCVYLYCSMSVIKITFENKSWKITGFKARQLAHVFDIK